MQTYLVLRYICVCIAPGVMRMCLFENKSKHSKHQRFEKKTHEDHQAIKTKTEDDFGCTTNSQPPRHALKRSNQQTNPLDTTARQAARRLNAPDGIGTWYALRTRTLTISVPGMPTCPNR